MENDFAATSYALIVWELFFSDRNCCIQHSCHFRSASLFSLDGRRPARPISSESNLLPSLPLSGLLISCRSPSPVNPSRLPPRTACASLSRRTKATRRIGTSMLLHTSSGRSGLEGGHLIAEHLRRHAQTGFRLSRGSPLHGWIQPRRPHTVCSAVLLPLLLR